MHHSSWISSVAISPDGSQIVSGSGEQILIWKAMTGEIECELRGHSGSVLAVAFSSDGNRIVTGSGDKTVRIWSGADWKMEHVLEGHSGIVLSVAFSLDGTHIVSGSDDKTVRVWAVDTGWLKWVLEGHSNGVNCVAFSHRHIASGSGDGIRIWGAHTGRVRILTGNSVGVNSLAFSSDGSRLASGSTSTIIWDTHTWELVCTWEESSECVAFSPDGHHLVSGSYGVWIWIADTGGKHRELHGHEGSVMSVAFSRDGNRVVSASSDGTVRTWNLETQRMPEHLSHSMNNHIRRIWDTVRVTTIMEPGIMELDSNHVHSLAFSPDGSCIVSASGSTLRLWRTSTAELEYVLRHSDLVNCVAFSPCGRHVVSGSWDAAVHIWSAITGKEESLFKGHSSGVSFVTFSPCGSRVASGSHDCTLRIWNAITRTEVSVLSGHSDSVSAVAFSHDGSHVASGSQDGTVRIWNVATGEAECILKGHWNLVTCVAFSRDDSRFVSASLDDTVKIWDITTQEFTESFQLLDGSQVNHLGKGRFQILESVNQDVTIQASLSSDLKWLLGGSRTHDCWIAAEYRRRVMALSGSNVCIGYINGQVVIIDLATRSHED